MLASEGGEFDVVNGWERMAYIKPSSDFKETHSFRFKETFDVVAEEVGAVSSSVGLAEVNGFNRIEITGTGIHDWLEGLFCGRVQRNTGKVGLGYMLNYQGNVKAEATITNIEEGRVWYGSAAASECHDMEWLEDHLPKDGSISLKSLTNDCTALVLAGPKARTVLAEVTRLDCSPESFGWLSVSRHLLASPWL